MRMKMPELPFLVGSGTWKTTRSTQLLSFCFVYHSKPMPPSVLSAPFSTTKRPGPTCCQPSRSLPLNSGCQPPSSFALELMAASPASATTQPRERYRRGMVDSSWCLQCHCAIPAATAEIQHQQQVSGQHDQRQHRYGFQRGLLAAGDDRFYECARGRIGRRDLRFVERVVLAEHTGFLLRVEGIVQTRVVLLIMRGERLADA